MKIKREPNTFEGQDTWKVAAEAPKEVASSQKIQEFLHTLTLRRLSSYSVRSYGYDLVIVHRWLSESKLRIYHLQGKHQFSFIEFQNSLKHGRATINRRLVTLRSFYFFCTGRNLERVGKGLTLPPGNYRGSGKEFMGIVSRPHKDKVQLKLKQERLLVVPLKPDQVNLFVKDIKNYRDLAVVALMLFCGLRSGEVRSLDLSSLNFERREIRVYGKGSKERLLPLPETVINLIQSYLKWERPTSGEPLPVFLVGKGPNRGNRLTAAGFRSFFRYRRKISGIHSANPHRFRHSFGTNLAKSGINLRLLQELLGHAPGSPVTQRYLHLSIGDVADAFNAVHNSLEKQYAPLG